MILIEKKQCFVYTKCMEIYNETKMLMKKYGLDFKKKFGQNFLVSEEILEEIIMFSDITNEDIVLEIGPGIGTLTSKLLSKAKHVISVEIDDELVKPLTDRFFMYKNFTLIHDDILKINLKEELEKIISKYYDLEMFLEGDKKIKVVANIPYYITTPILLELISKREYISEIYIMVQKEVSERLRATLGTREGSSITYMTNYYSNCIGYIDVPKGNFIPEPKVDSEVIGLRLRKVPYPEVVDEDMYFKIIKAGFMHRRKTFLNSVKLSGLFDMVKIKGILEKLEIDERVRPEKLTEIDYANIVNNYKRK